MAVTHSPATHSPGRDVVADGGPRAVRRSSADRFMRRVLRLPPDGRVGTAEDARKAFQTSMVVAGFRCVLMYLVFPFVLPTVGILSGVGPVVGLLVNTAAMVFIVLSMRRFFRADHPKRWHYAALGGTVMVLLSYLAVLDVIDLVS